MRYLLLATLFCSPFATAQKGRAIEDGDLKELAESFSAYFEARDQGDGSDEARAALEAELAAALGEKNPLRDSDSLARALWLSHDYPRTRLREGKIESASSPAGTFAAGSLNYSYRVPRDYDPKEHAYPLLLTIPGDDERPDEHIRLHWSSREFREGAIVVCPEMPTVVEEWDRPMVNGRPGGLSHVLTALRLAGEQFAIDFDRVFVAGHDKSVRAAISTGNFAPQRFAGVIGRGGDAGELAPENFQNLPTLFFGAGANARDFQKAIQDLGFDNCELNPTGKELDVWNWMQEHPRTTYPTEARVVPGLAFPTRSYWLDTSAMARDAQAIATIEKESNTIRIESQGVSHVTLYLNDELINLNAPITVIRNKVETIEVIERRLPVTLDLLRNGTSDSGCVYVAEAVFDMRTEEGAAKASQLASDSEFRDRLKATSGNIEQLWKVHLWCLTSDRSQGSTAVLNRIIRLDPEHAEARAALGHKRSGEQWFSSEAALARFKESQDESVAEQRGYVKHRDTWMHPDERAFASKGLVKDQETGLWASAAERRRLAQGWIRMDLEWIEPEFAERIDDGQWLVDGEWLEITEANRRHSRIDRMWTIPTAEILLHTTAEREVAHRAIEQMGRAIGDLRKVFGSEPALPLEVAMLSYEEQYDRFAFGATDGRRAATHAGRMHVIHSAYFAESWFPVARRKRHFKGMGVCYWNANAPYGDAYGLHSARLALGLSYVEALDPSPKAVRRAELKGLGETYYTDYQAEKQLPGWLRYGGAVYAERFFEDDSVAEGGDPWWARKWSLENLAGRGGLRELDSVLEFKLNPEDPDDGLKLLIEAGLLVAFIVDGNCEPVNLAHAELKAALRAGRVNPKLIEGLEEALRASQKQLKAFATL